MNNSTISVAGPQQRRTIAVKQAAAICYRVSEEGTPLLLLITSRDTRRWVIPRGNIELGEKSYETAEREAFEEAGVLGKVRKKAAGFYTFVKDGCQPYAVAVHALRIDSTTDFFKEKGQRESVWVAPDDAASRVQETGLKTIFRHFKMKFCGALYRSGD